MIKVLIIEDEALSAQRAAQLLKEYDTTIEVLQILDSVEDSTTWLLSNAEPDLILLDIHLADGLCFSLFEQVNIRCPVIFTTAYDQYALQAFKTNGIDYLLKPLDLAGLTRALSKYKNFLQDKNGISTIEIQHIRETISSLGKKYKERFLVKFGDTIQFKNIEEIAYFYADDKVVYLVTNEGRKYLIDYNLESLERLLNPGKFYRANRKVITHIEAIIKIKTLLNSRLEVFLQPAFEQKIFVSKEKSGEFKAWLDQ